jgi:hypothetical protein
MVLLGDHVDGLESPLGLVVRFNNSVAWQWMAGSVSSSRMDRSQPAALTLDPAQEGAVLDEVDSFG